jgi:hypothetical protein
MSDLQRLPEKVDSPAEESEEDPRQGLPENVRVEVGAPVKLSEMGKHAPGPWIQYDGVGTLRVLTPEDWNDLGIKNGVRCEWNYLNHMRLPRSMFNDEMLQYLLNVDMRFSVVSEKVSESA